MRLIADTNLIVRVLTQDNPHQSATAARVLSEADLVVFSIVALCETVWTLRSRYRWRTAEIAEALRTLLSDPRIECDRDLAHRGLAMLDAGGDFADAVIAGDGRRYANAPVATFDREAARLLTEQGVSVTLLG